MITDIKTFLEFLDFDKNIYFYHQTNLGNSESIIENGLRVKGENILDVKNILYTTAIELKSSDVKDLTEFLDFIEEANFSTPFRNTLEMIILVSPKEYGDDIVEKYGELINGEYYEGIVQTDNILAYINVLTKEVKINEECSYYIEPYSL